MSHPDPTQLTRAEQLFDDGKLDEALELLNDLNQLKDLDHQQKRYQQFLKGLILFYQYKRDVLVKFGESLFTQGKDNNDDLQSVDGLFFSILGLSQDYKFEKALELILKAEALLKSISNKSSKQFLQREARIAVSKAFINIETGNIDVAEKYSKKCLELHNDIGDSFEIVWANILVARINFHFKYKFDLFIKYTNNALQTAKRIKFNHFWIAFCYLAYGVFNYAIGELKISLKLQNESLEIYRQINSDWFIAGIINNIGLIYRGIGEYDIAMKYLEESLLLLENQSIDIELPLCNLIELALEGDNSELAQQYYDRLERQYQQKKEGITNTAYTFAKALMLKKSSRIRDKARAEELFKKIIEAKTWHFDAIITAHIHLCDLLLAEFHINHSPEVLDEINHHIANLLITAEKQHSYIVFCETFILKAKLAMITLKMKEARRFLTQAQKIADAYGLNRLAMKISYEHDELLRQIKIWENFKESETNISERFKLAGLSKHMENMVKKRMSEMPDVSEEEPISMYIITEGGLPLLSHSFINQKSFESHLFSGFLTTIDNFIREMFSEGLDRAVFGDYTLLMKFNAPFYVSYIFKGDSYYADQKIKYFMNHIQNEEDIWRFLLKSFHLNQSINLKDLPLLETLVAEVFITKSIVSSDLSLQT